MATLIETAAGRLEILNRYKNVAIVGLSGNAFRPSHFAAIYMLSYGYNIIPINPRETEILGRKCYASLAEASAALPGVIEIVDVFRNPRDVLPLVAEAASIGARVLWLQLGVIHEEAARAAVAAGMDVVMDRCVKIEHARFFGGLNLIGLNTGVITSRRR